MSGATSPTYSFDEVAQLLKTIGVSVALQALAVDTSPSGSAIL
jgi:hypothetical protein